MGISDPRNLLSSAVPVKQFSVFLGYTHHQARAIIDQAYSELYPAYSIFYAKHRTVEEILDRLQGLHLVHRLERNDRVRQFTRREDNIVQMPLTVRYMLKGTKPTVSELYRVRCKLNIPSYTAATECFEYDGYITPQKYDTNYWVFENRSEENKDLIFMITDSFQMLRRHEEPTKAHDFTQGIMLTRRQDAWPTHKIWKVVVVKAEPDSPQISLATTPDSESTFMTTQCKVVAEDEAPLWVVQHLKDGWPGLEFF